uniref:Uncharacterized protein n=1 Tax=Timema monikensis TaxID=170555 RepID=A0A7R9EEP7_9NEOP|nr:unnamed protein product [Timema monikensis]
MLKWLAGNHPKNPLTDIVTDDPLATIRVQKIDRSSEIYAVSRINPLFDDDVAKRRGSSDPQKIGGCESPNKSSSSGYGSNNLYHSSSEYSSGTEEINGQRVYIGLTRGQTPPDPPHTPTVLRDDALTVLEQNIGFVKSILVAVKGSGGNPSAASAAKKHKRRPSGTSAATLSPIPEGKVDYTIPRPVWPRDEIQTKRDLPLSPTMVQSRGIPSSGAQADSIVDDALLIYTNVSYPPSTSSSSEGCQRENSVDQTLSLEKSVGDPQRVSSDEILKELSHTINLAMSRKQTFPPEDLLKGLSDTINRGLETLWRTHPPQGSEDALRKLSYTLSHSEYVTRLSRAFSNSSGSSGGSLSSPSDTDRARLMPHRGLDASEGAWQGRNKGEPCPARDSDDDTQPRGSTTSSSDSEFSELYQTTPQTTPSSSVSPTSRRAEGLSRPPVFLHESTSTSPASRRAEGLSRPPVFLHEDLSGLPNNIRNAMIYGTLCRGNTAKTASAEIVYEKLRNSGGAGDSGVREGKGLSPGKGDGQDLSLWETYSGVGVNKGDVQLKSKGESFLYLPVPSTNHWVRASQTFHTLQVTNHGALSGVAF